jgi:hypothetical protein
MAFAYGTALLRFGGSVVQVAVLPSWVLVYSVAWLLAVVFLAAHRANIVPPRSVSTIALATEAVSIFAWIAIGMLAALDASRFILPTAVWGAFTCALPAVVLRVTWTLWELTGTTRPSGIDEGVAWVVAGFPVVGLFSLHAFGGQTGVLTAMNALGLATALVFLMLRVRTNVFSFRTRAALLSAFTVLLAAQVAPLIDVSSVELAVPSFSVVLVVALAQFPLGYFEGRRSKQIAGGHA